MSFDDQRREPGAPRPPTTWLEDSVGAGERKRRMLEKARELGCVEAVQAMFVMVGAVEGFRRMQELYLGPSAEDFKKQEKRFKPGAAKAEAWKEVGRVQAQFDLPNAAGPSDWLRLVGVLKAALKPPSEDVPGVFQTKRTDPPENAEKFKQWALAHYLHPQALRQVAQRLEQDMQLYTPADVEKLCLQLEKADARALSHVIIAGFELPEVYVDDYGFLAPM